MNEFNDEEAKQVVEAMGFTPDDTHEKTPADRAREAHAQGHAALKSAERAARRNDLAAAKQWTATAQRMADIAAQLANTPLPLSSWEQSDEVREDLRARLTKIAGDEDALNRWRMRLEIWEDMNAEAQRTGAPPPSPMPPRPPHWSDTLPENLRRRILDEPADAASVTPQAHEGV